MSLNQKSIEKSEKGVQTEISRLKKNNDPVKNEDKKSPYVYHDFRYH